MPFYYRIGQPWRGLLAILFSAALGAIFYFAGTQKLLWSEDLKSYAYAALPAYLLVLFVWMFVYQHFFQFWPWGKLSQPTRGIAVTLTIVIASAINFYVLFYMAHWGAHFMSIVSAWLFWVNMLSVFTDNPLVTQYRGKQPLCGISGYVITFGMALLTWWIVPQTFLGNNTGVPFIWFTAAVFIAFCLHLFPVQIALPWRAIGLTGWFVTISFILAWIFKAAGVDAFEVVAQGEPAKGSIFGVILLLGLLVPVAMFQMWPFNKLPPLQKGFLWIVLGILLGIGGYWAFISITLDPVIITKAVTVCFCFFLGMFTYFVNFDGAMAPIAVSEQEAAAAAAHHAAVSNPAAAELAAASKH